MISAVIHRTRFAFRVGFYEETSEVGYERIYLLSLLCPPLLHFLVERVSGFQSAKNLWRSEIDGEIDLYAVRAKCVGNALCLF